jgi:hypothetical protein
MFKTDSFLGNKKLSLNQNVWRDHKSVFCQFPFRWIYYYGSHHPPERKLAKRTSVHYFVAFLGDISKLKSS